MEHQLSFTYVFYSCYFKVTWAELKNLPTIYLFFQTNSATLMFAAYCSPSFARLGGAHSVVCSVSMSVCVCYIPGTMGVKLYQ